MNAEGIKMLLDYGALGAAMVVLVTVISVLLVFLHKMTQVVDRTSDNVNKMRIAAEKQANAAKEVQESVERLERMLR